ncbi:MAG: hypothetical protein QG671_3449 [Actinomycetota bacterium]|nr:hypothetical protein [Actinomycetota bacterium]
MRNSTKVVAALGAAALVAAGGAAYTAANSVPGTTTQGYGATTVTGVTVATMAVNPATNPTNLSTIVYTVTGDVSTTTFTVTLNPGGTQVSVPCTPVYANPTTTITCTPGGTVTMASIDGIGLTAYKAPA